MVGGLEGINKAIECNNTATCEYSSGLQVIGVFTEVLADAKERRSICALPDHRRSRSRTRNFPGMAAIITRKALVRQSEIGNRQKSLKARCQRSTSKVASRLKAGRKTSSSRRPTAADHFFKLHGETMATALFDPSWGTYDMAVGDDHVRL